MSPHSLTIPAPEMAAPCQGFLTRLILRCGARDEAALGDLFDLTFVLVAAALNRGAASAAVVDDEIVEAFRRIWRRSPFFVPTERGALAWVLDQVTDGLPLIVTA